MRSPVDFISNKNGYEYLDYVSFGVLHSGKDFNLGSGSQDEGLPVYAITDGEVVYSKNSGAWGNLVVIYHPAYGVWTRSAHLKDVFVKVGDKIKEGVQIGTIGGTGGWSPHLHFDLILKELSSWTKYTTGMSEKKVREYYADPELWINEMIADEQKNKEELTPDIVKWAKKNKIITNWALPYRDEDIKMAYALYKLGYLIAPANKKAMFDLEEINKEM